MARKQTAKKKQTTSGSGKRGGLTKIGALWIKSGNNGKFMSGTLSLDDENPNMIVKVLVFKNGYKEEAKHPDYVVYVPAEEIEKASNPEITDDDIPF